MWSEWKDSRLTYVNLDTTNETIINDYEEQKIWVPRYTIWKVNEDGLREDDSFQTLSATPVKEGKLICNLYSF